MGARCSRLAFAVLVVAVALTSGGRVLAAGPSATISPDRALQDRQIATVRASGFPANVNVELIECEGTVQRPPKDASTCDGISADVTGYSDRQGNFVDAPGGPPGGPAGYRIFLLPTPLETGVTTHCGPRNPCVLYVGVNFEDFTQPKTFVALNFAGSPASGSGSGGFPWVPVIGVAAVGVVFLGGGGLIWRRRVKSGGRSVAQS